MKNTLKNLKSSCSELKSIHALTLCGILLALRVVLGFLEINIGDSYRITFSAIPVGLTGYMFGAVPGAIVGACGDIITLIIKPTGGINFGILLAKALYGFILGLILYKKPANLVRTIIACTIAVIICNLAITTASLCIAYGYPFGAIFPVRLVTNAITLPIDISLIFVFQKLANKIKFHSVRTNRI